MLRISSEESLRMTGQDGWSFLAGKANTLEMMRCRGKEDSWAAMSPLAMAASRHGMMISLYTISGTAAGGVTEEMGSPRMRSDVARDAWSSLLTWLVNCSILASRVAMSCRRAAFSDARDWSLEKIEEIYKLSSKDFSAFQF